ncbi:MAG: MFS transporter [Pseudomonadota bacterium]
MTYSWQDLGAALRKRKSLAMFVLGFAAGLPYVLITGTLNAWFTNEGVSIATIGVFSWIIILYSFKFLWSPAIDRAPTPPIFNMGQRRATILVLQSVILLCLLAISTIDPKSAIGLIAVAAILCTVASASQDVLIDAWRIEVADEETTIDLLSAIYQLGYRTSVILGGAGALIVAARIGWNSTFVVLSVLMAVAVSGVFIAGDSDIVREQKKNQTLPPAQWRNLALTPVILGWSWSFTALFGFMAFALSSPDQANARAFTLQTGPLIITASIIAPVLASAGMLYAQRRIPAPATALATWPGQTIFDGLYGSILAPMADIIDRLRWRALLVLLVALSYRFADLIWGAFAYPFYLGENYGALGHTLDEVAIASKLFGAVMTFVGIGVGGALILRIGRMPCLVIGAVMAAATNLLFADLALGGEATHAFMSSTGLYGIFSVFQPLANFLSLDVTVNEALSRLMIVIAAENLAVGFASAAIVVYLSSVVNKKYAAVQYALLASLGFLLGSLGRGAIGELIEINGFAYVFYLTAAMGLVAVAATAFDWVTLARRPTKEEAETA